MNLFSEIGFQSSVCRTLFSELCFWRVCSQSFAFRIGNFSVGEFGLGTLVLELWFGTFVLELLFGTFVWDLCVGTLLGNFVWEICVGTLVWEISLGLLLGNFSGSWGTRHDLGGLFFCWGNQAGGVGGTGGSGARCPTLKTLSKNPSR